MIPDFHRADDFLVRTARSDCNRKLGGRRSGGAALTLLLACALAACGQTAEERRVSIYELRADPTEENIARIRGMLSDPDRDVRATALNTLVGMRQPDADALTLDGLRDADGFVRSIAAKLVGDLGTVERVPLLVELLQADPYPRARQTAAESLERLGGEAAIDGLLRGLEDPIKEVRLASVKGIRALDPRRAMPVLARLLLEDTVWEIRVQAAGALGRIGDPEVVPVLEAAIDDESEFVRSAAANALAELGHPLDVETENPGRVLSE